MDVAVQKLNEPIHSRSKQLERSTRIANLPSDYHSPLSPDDREVLSKPVEELVQDVHKQLLKPIDILRSYGKVAIKAQEKTNCLTEVMLTEAEQWAKGEINLKGPLAGVPVSLKDSIAVGGFDVSVGYSCNTGKPYTEDGIMVKILKDAGLGEAEVRCLCPLRDTCRSHSVREDQSANHFALIRVYQRRVGSVHQPTQLKILARWIDWRRGCIVGLRWRPDRHWVRCCWLCESASPL